MPHVPMAAPPLPAESTRWALFLDVDGSLVDFAATPDGVHLNHEVIALLDRLSRGLDGALALLSGRRLSDIDRLTAPLILPAAGLHGMERRDAGGGLARQILPDPTMVHAVRERVRRLAARFPQVLLEDKGACLALHFRSAPELERRLRAACKRIVKASRGSYELQPGMLVFELKPVGSDKGRALAAFLTEAPFAGRLPVAIGDDLTDEHAFDAANRAEGLSIRVGPRISAAARYGLPGPAAVRHWLEGVSRSLGARAEALA